MIRNLGQMSDREVAKVCAVHHTFVGRVREQVVPNTTSTSPAKRLGSDGKIYPASQPMRHEPRGEARPRGARPRSA